jgi:hypothetical protein
MQISGLQAPAALPILKDPAVTPWIGGGLGSKTSLNGSLKKKCLASSGNRAKTS